MSDGESWLMRPVEAGYCKYESLLDGTLDLGDVYRMNEAIDVVSENRYRAQKALESKLNQTTKRR